MSMAWVRKYYGVPAKRGGRVRFTAGGRDELGTIRSARGGKLNIQLDSLPYVSSYHPTWRLEYLDSAKQEAR